MATVVCVGHAVYDVLVHYVSPEIFKQDTTYVQGIHYSCGGDALNESIIFSRHGHKAHLMASVGEDSFGDLILAHLQSNGVGVENVLRNTWPTTTALVMVQENGDRNFVCNDGSNAHFMPECIGYDLIQQADLVTYGSLFTNPGMDAPALEVLRAAKEGGAITAADVLYREGDRLENLRDCMPYLDYIFPNYEEAVGLTGKEDIDEIADVILGLGVKNALIKIGKRGCYVATQADGRYIVPTYKNGNRVDTTGAGDNFAAGTLSALLEGKPLREAVAWGNATASVAIGYPGATGLKSREEIEEMIAGGILVVED